MTVAELTTDEVTQQLCANRLLSSPGEPSLAFRGFSKFAWLNALKNSVRTWNFTRSVTLKFFRIPMSTFQKPGPRTEFRPELPCFPGAGMQKNVLVGLPEGVNTFRQLKFGSFGSVMRGPTL